MLPVKDPPRAAAAPGTGRGLGHYVGVHSSPGVHQPALYPDIRVLPEDELHAEAPDAGGKLLQRLAVPPQPRRRTSFALSRHGGLPYPRFAAKAARRSSSAMRRRTATASLRRSGSLSEAEASRMASSASRIESPSREGLIGILVAKGPEGIRASSRGLLPY